MNRRKTIQIKNTGVVSKQSDMEFIPSDRIECIGLSYKDLFNSDYTLMESIQIIAKKSVSQLKNMKHGSTKTGTSAKAVMFMTF